MVLILSPAVCCEVELGLAEVLAVLQPHPHCLVCPDSPSTRDGCHFPGKGRFSLVMLIISPSFLELLNPAPAGILTQHKYCVMGQFERAMEAASCS